MDIVRSGGVWNGCSEEWERVESKGGCSEEWGSIEWM